MTTAPNKRKPEFALDKFARFSVVIQILLERFTLEFRLA